MVDAELSRVVAGAVLPLLYPHALVPHALPPPPSLYPRLLLTRSNKMTTTTLDVVLQNERYLPGNRLLHRRDTPVDTVEHSPIWLHYLTAYSILAPLF